MRYFEGALTIGNLNLTFVDPCCWDATFRRGQDTSNGGPESLNFVVLNCYELKQLPNKASKVTR